MVADVQKVWDGATWTTVVVKDHADGVTKMCRVWMKDEMGPWIASLCKSSKGPVVLTVNPPENGEFEITDAEKFPEEAA